MLFMRTRDMFSASLTASIVVTPSTISRTTHFPLVNASLHVNGAEEAVVGQMTATRH